MSFRPLALLVLLLSASFLQAQEKVKEEHEVYFEQIQAIIVANSSKEMAVHLFDKVEINIDGQRNEYSQSQAEAVLKSFFQDNSATEFAFLHDGKNNARDLIYAIGSYQTTSNTYRLLVRAKRAKDSYKIFRIEFTKSR